MSIGWAIFVIGWVIFGLINFLIYEESICEDEVTHEYEPLSPKHSAIALVICLIGGTALFWAFVIGTLALRFVFWLRARRVTQ